MDLNAPHLPVAATVQATATVVVTGDASQEVSWSSSNASVATVSEDGAIFGVAPGTVTFTATSVADPTVSDSASIEVVPRVWATQTPMPQGVSRPAGVFADGRFFVLSGEANGVPRSGAVQVFDPLDGTWSTSTPDMPQPAINFCAVELDGGIYALGGNTSPGVQSDALRRLDLTTETWAVLTADAMPDTRHTHACAVHDGVIYVFSGHGADASSAPREPWAYDPTLPEGERWTTGLSEMPRRGRYGSAVTIGDHIYYAGAAEAEADVDADWVSRYHPATDTWEELPPLQVARGGAQVWTDGQHLFVGGGGWFDFLSSVEVYDTSAGLSGSWRMTDPTDIYRRTAAVGYDPDTDTVYVAGGYGGAGGGIILAGVRSATGLQPWP